MPVRKDLPGRSLVYDIAEPIVAYRSWLCFKDGLRAIAFGYIWESAEVTARPCQITGPSFDFAGRNIPACGGPPCDTRKVFYHPPLIAHGCGFYAHKRISQALFTNPGCVLGKVLLAGKVWRHTDGYRAEKAKIIGLYHPDALEPYERYLEYARPPRLMPPLGDLAERYKVPLIEPTASEDDEIRTEGLRYWVAHLIESKLNMDMSR